MPPEIVNLLAEKVTRDRIIGKPEMIQLVAQQASGKNLPDAVVQTYVEYWGNYTRDANLGQYIMQIAECSEKCLYLHGNKNEL